MPSDLRASERPLRGGYSYPQRSHLSPSSQCPRWPSSSHGSDRRRAGGIDREGRSFHRIARAWGVRVATASFSESRFVVENLVRGPCVDAEPPIARSSGPLSLADGLSLCRQTEVRLLAIRLQYLARAQCLDRRAQTERVPRLRRVSPQSLAAGSRSSCFPRYAVGTWKVGRFKRGAFELRARRRCQCFPSRSQVPTIAHAASMRIHHGDTRIIIDVLPAIESLGKTARAPEKRARGP